MSRDFDQRDFRQLINACAYFNALRSVCGRGDYLSERSLTEPIAEFAVSRGINSKFNSEYSHPFLGSIAAIGRPRQLDFAFTIKNKVRVALETKWAPAAASDVVADIARLGLMLSSPGAPVERYFLLSGKTYEVSDLLARKMQIGGRLAPYFADILPLDEKKDPTKSFLLHQLDPKLRKLWADAILKQNPKRDLATGAFCGLKISLIRKRDIQSHMTLGWKIERRRRFPLVPWETLEAWSAGR